MSLKRRHRAIHLSWMATVSMLIMAVGWVVGTAPAYAYSGGNAANYADAHATNHNGNYPDFSADGDDCTGFTSQSMNQGGFSLVNVGQDVNNDNNWWYQRDWLQVLHRPQFWDWSHAWSVAPEQYNFLMWHYPGGWNWGTVSGTSNTAYSNGLWRGDILYYRWTGSDIKHDAMQVYIQGTDPNSGWRGDLVDEHSSDRYHAIWTLEPYNASAWQTTITLVHVDPGNN